MASFVLRRLLLVPLALAAINFASFAYAHLALQAQAALNPYGTAAAQAAPVWTGYGDYVRAALRGEFGTLPTTARESVPQAVLQAAGASLGLLALAFLLSVAVGVLLGLRAVRSNPPGVARWLLPASAVGLATPSFFIGAVAIALLLLFAVYGGREARTPIPLFGFGWDAHLLLPLAALAARPAAQIAQMVSGLMVAELEQQYVVAARSRGTPWPLIRWKHALRNALAPAILAFAGSFRLLIGELVIVEWLFAWPGLGRLLALTLLPPTSATLAGLSGAKSLFLHPQLVPALLTAFGVLFLLADTIASLAARAVDPRLGRPELEERDA